eukprot:14504748-Alexandrium_andersonii.AAC.1
MCIRDRTSPGNARNPTQPRHKRPASGPPTASACKARPCASGTEAPMRELPGRSQTGKARRESMDS